MTLNLNNAREAAQLVPGIYAAILRDDEHSANDSRMLAEQLMSLVPASMAAGMLAQYGAKVIGELSAESGIDALAQVQASAHQFAAPRHDNSNTG